MKKNFNLKRRILIGLFLLGIIFIFYGIIFVNAEWTSPDTGYLIENIGSSNDQSAFTSASQKIFYCENNSRWYVLYPVDADVDDFCGYYSYSDADDPTTWNNGGMIGMQMRSTATIGSAIGSQLAWTYSNNNSIGHIVTFWDTTGGANRGLYYANFTVEPDGSLDFSSRTKIIVMDGGCYGSVDIALSYDNHPIIGFGGLYNADYHHLAMICDTFNGHTGTWTVVEYQPQWAYSDVAIIPTGNNTCLLLSANVNTVNPLKYYNIEFGVTSNSSGSGTSLTDLNVIKDGSQTSYGVSYNLTHGCVHYIVTNYNCYAFIFDFETMTKTDEYLTDSEGYEGYEKYYAGATIHKNEFFVTNKLKRMATGDKSIYGNEYHNPSYPSYFNASAIDYILYNYTQTYNTYHVDCMNTARMSINATGINLIVYEQEGSVYATYWTLEGEYIGNGNGNDDGNGIEEFDWSGVKYWLAIIVFFIIVIFAIYIKKS